MAPGVGAGPLTSQGFPVLFWKREVMPAPASCVVWTEWVQCTGCLGQGWQGLCQE